jgi:hypothetical protein
MESPIFTFFLSFGDFVRNIDIFSQKLQNGLEVLDFSVGAYSELEKALLNCPNNLSRSCLPS